MCMLIDYFQEMAAMGEAEEVGVVHQEDGNMGEAEGNMGEEGHLKEEEGNMEEEEGNMVEVGHLEEEGNMVVDKVGGTTGLILVMDIMCMIHLDISLLTDHQYTS